MNIKSTLFLTVLLTTNINAFVIRDFPSALSDFAGGALHLNEFFNPRIREGLFLDFGINSGIDNVYTYSAGVNYNSKNFLLRVGYSYLPIRDLELRTGEVKIDPDGYFDVVYIRPMLGIVGSVGQFIYLAEVDVARYQVINYSINREAVSVFGGKTFLLADGFYSARVLLGTKNSQRGDVFNFSAIFSNKFAVNNVLDADVSYWFLDAPLGQVHNVDVAFTISDMFNFRAGKDFGNGENIANFGTGVDVFGVNLFYNIKLFDDGLGVLHSGGLRVPL